MVRLANRAEFDLDAGIWSLSAERMKAHDPFKIPLSAEVIALVRKIYTAVDSPFLFPGQGKSGAMCEGAMRTLLHAMGHTDITRHGFRSSFRDWANECTNHTRQVCELALAHDDRDQTEAAYSRSDLFEKRRLLMNDWAQYATAPQKRLNTSTNTTEP
jgi:integrase